ncbi:MAG TPA: hypothetical protein DCY07_01525 [Rhodospirillaceae bacterium]|nr:hypothetical protein [Rhodospirillaceae bacterium]
MFRSQSEKRDPLKQEGWVGLLLKRARRVLMVFVALSLIGGAVLAPQPAQAVVRSGDVVYSPTSLAISIWGTLAELAQWVKKHEAILTIVNWIAQIVQMFQDGLVKLRQTWGASAQVQLGAQHLKVKTEMEIAEAIINARAVDAVNSEKLVHIAEHSIPPASEQFLCNLILARQVVPVMTEFARIISSVVTRGMNERYRSKTSDGSGPQYVADAWNLKCGKYGTNWAPTGNIIDGVPPECRAEITPPNIGYADGDVSADTLGRDKIYTVPPIVNVEKEINGVTQTVRDFVPEEGNEAHRQWIMARQYCYNVAGPRVSPPWGADIDKPDGKTKYGRFATCLAQQSAFVKICSDRLAKLTQPDCSNKDFKVFCDASVQACDAARKANIVLPPAYNDCGNGLSLYQAEYLSNILCGSNRRIQADKHGGAKDPDGTRTLMMCQLMKEAWEKRMEDEDKAFLRAVISIQNMKECWIGAGR